MESVGHLDLLAFVNQQDIVVALRHSVVTVHACHTVLHRFEMHGQSVGSIVAIVAALLVIHSQTLDDIIANSQVT